MHDIVKVVPYNAEWPQKFTEEAEKIKHALGNNCIEIHHIGSTAVPGLNAKPTIDILPVVTNILHVDAANQAMEKLGYEAKGENGIPFRRFFQKKSPHQNYNVHVFERDNPEIDRHLKFRDWMRLHVSDREQYGKLKTELAVKFPHDIQNYCLGKDDFIAGIDAKTGFDGLRIVSALTDREWKAVREFRQKYFFDKVPIADPYTSTFNHPQHVHFILFKGSKIVGYAHIQLWPENRAALRIIVIDELYRKKGIGSEFLTLCESWLSQQDITKLHIQSTAQAYQFYRNKSYIEMPFNDPEGFETHPKDIEMGKNLK